MTDDKAARIRALNDALRQKFEGGRILLTCGLTERGPDFVLRVVEGVRAFDAFTEANDPFREHDFGALEIDGQMVFFKIDYYDPAYEFGAQDPSDEATCSRVLTIMLAEEY